MNKVFYIENCYFRLPEDFNGTCGDALMLLALRRLEQEERRAILKDSDDESRIDNFWNSDKKCTIAYCICTEDSFRTK